MHFRKGKVKRDDLQGFTVFLTEFRHESGLTPAEGALKIDELQQLGRRLGGPAGPLRRPDSSSASQPSTYCGSPKEYAFPDGLNSFF